MEDSYSFAAGPAQMPNEVLVRIRDEMLNCRGSGQSILELPFTGAVYGAIAEQAEARLRQLVSIPESYRVLFLQGGAYAQFALVAMNLMGSTGRADYVETGHWSTRAIGEARRYGRVDVIASAEGNGFTRIPPWQTWCPNPEAAYCHITTNETADGLQYHWLPDPGGSPLVADMTSDFLTRPLAIERFGLIYASAQKNIGPAGLTIVIVRDDLLEQAQACTPGVFNYGIQAASHSRTNTPPTFAVYTAGLVFDWISAQGGLDTMARNSLQKSRLLYEAIDDTPAYSCPVERDCRSLSNVCFRLDNPKLVESFLEGAERHGLFNLRGHGARGGLRASLYNAMPVSGVERLVDYMKEFSSQHSSPKSLPII
ncbi:MAG: 3-phosphoserine/phosphohydroxythreonine transaminase [Gammaproteobacteria bacterium]|nr:3-phosphoserine/phosphohydroxythreonine transaminase [Gammaproteobacteria bacterium]